MRSKGLLLLLTIGSRLELSDETLVTAAGADVAPGEDVKMALNVVPLLRGSLLCTEPKEVLRR
jgi:hypothetical protein